MMASLLPACFADDAGQTANEKFDGKTWDDIMAEFMEQHSITTAEEFTCGYINLVTGETHYINPDQYMVSGSMYKVPINMIFAEKLSRGEISWDTVYGGLTYKQVQELTIRESNDQYAEVLWNALGGYMEYRRQLAPVCGEDPDTVDAMFYKNNFFTPTQVIYYLNTLYNNQDTYPGVIDNMLLAHPGKYFLAHDHDVEIGHKYGYLDTDYHFYLNDSAICFTTEPIGIVVFTDNANKPYEILADYCDLMIEWAEYSTVQRLAEEEKQAELKAIAELEAKEEAAQAALQSGTTGTGNAQNQTVGSQKQTISANAKMYVFLIPILVLGLAAVIIAALKFRTKKIKSPWAVAAILLTVIALALCPIAEAKGSLYVKRDGDPQQTVEDFFTALEDEDYDTVCKLLQGYRSLGLENTPDTDAGKLVYEALKNSYSYKLYGDCVIDGASAEQQVLFTYLDLKSMKEDLKAETEKQVSSMVTTMQQEEVYDGDNEYKETFLNEAYRRAVQKLLEHPSDYYTTTGMELTLTYQFGEWTINSNQALLNVICGGAY